MSAMAAPTTFTVDELAEILKVNPRTVYRALERGELRGFKIGASWRVTQQSLDEFMSRSGGGAGRPEGEE